MGLAFRAPLAVAALTFLIGTGCDALDDGSLIPGEVVVALEPGTPEATLYRYADPRGLRVLSLYVPGESIIPPAPPSLCSGCRWGARTGG